MKQYDTGRSMIEMMGVLVIIGALSAGGIAGYTKALHQNKVKKAIEQINVISGHLSAIGANGGNYNRLTNTTAIKMKAVLPEMVTGAETLTNPFGGIVEIKESKLLSGSQEGQAYTIKYTGLDNQACLSLATNDWGSSKNSSLIGIAAGNGAIDNFYLNCKGNKKDRKSVV